MRLQQADGQATTKHLFSPNKIWQKKKHSKRARLTTLSLPTETNPKNKPTHPGRSARATPSEFCVEQKNSNSSHTQRNARHES